MNYRSPSEMTDGIVSSIANNGNWNLPNLSNTPKMHINHPTRVESSGLLFSKKDPRGFNLQNRKRFVDKHNLAEYGQFEPGSADQDSYESSLLNDNSGMLLDYSKLKPHRECEVYSQQS